MSKNSRSFYTGRSSWPGVLLVLSLLTFADTAGAHVKWFTQYSFSDAPLSFREVLTGNFFLLSSLSVFVISLLILLEERLMSVSWISRIDSWFAERSDHILYVMRIGVGVTLVWCWQAGTLLAPELKTSTNWAVWLQLLVAFLLVFPKTIPLAGAGLLILYAIGIYLFGLFHMFDYLLYVGVSWFFLVYESRKPRLKITALPALYATLGFCLIWLGIEKLVYPSWAKLLLQEHPQLALGVPHDFFVTAAALVEISLGFMILVCFRERLLAMVITLVFLLTTLVFGREELVGHTLIHTVLIVFLFAGPGEATPPLHWIRRLSLRLPAIAFAFVALTALLMLPYTLGSQSLYQSTNTMPSVHDRHNMMIDAGSGPAAPTLQLAVHKDPMSGWNVELLTENFTFAPESASRDHVAGQGHAHLLINDKKVARVYGPWFHIPNIPVGSHTITATLNANNHSQLAVDNIPVADSVELEVLPPTRPAMGN
jgi:uncharacterized membrane protein YphA (DoxX/SURF4 family)